ncbi:MAG: hypothetical protein KDB37_05595, partial [Ilumatobacter sp.]|nr:hypothetical protein [Ilumatobacter sp.]
DGRTCTAGSAGLDFAADGGDDSPSGHDDRCADHNEGAAVNECADVHGSADVERAPTSPGPDSADRSADDWRHQDADHPGADDHGAAYHYDAGRLHVLLARGRPGTPAPLGGHTGPGVGACVRAGKRR